MFQVGDKVHLGWGAPRGAGIYGTITKINSYDVEIITPGGKTYRGPIRNLSYELEEGNLMKDLVNSLAGLRTGKPLDFVNNIKARLSDKAGQAIAAEKTHISDQLFNENPETPGQNALASDVVSALEIKKKAVQDSQDESDEQDIDVHQDMYNHLRGEKIGQQKP